MKGYTTILKVENYLLHEIDESYHSQIERWIEAVEKFIDNRTGRDFGIAEELESGDSGDGSTERTYDGDGTNTIYIDPATDITAIKLSETGTALESTEYVLYPLRETVKDKILLKTKKFPKGIQNIYVTAIWGYDKIPADIEFAATVLVAGIANNQISGDGQIQSITIGRYSVSYRGESQADDYKQVEEILNQNKKYGF